MTFDVIHNIQLFRNRILRGGLQLLTDRPSDSILGEVGFFAANASAVESRLHTGVCVDDVGNAWSYLPGLNRTESIIGLWTFNPTKRGAGTGNGEAAPFLLGSNCVFQPGARLANRVTDLNSDFLDGFGAIQYDGTSAPAGGSVPVYNASGQLAGNDPVSDYDLVNKKTWQAGLTGLVVKTACQYATTVRLDGARAGNVITATNNGTLTIDGSLISSTGDRILLKNQQDSGGTAVDNGIYAVTGPGGAASKWILTRTADCDGAGDLTVGSLVFIESGTTNRATQWAAQKAPGVSGTAFTINTDEIFWQKSFAQSAYIAGNGIVISGLTIHFAQSTKYVPNSLFYANGETTVTELKVMTDALPRFVWHTGSAGDPPSWHRLITADITDWVVPVTPSPAGGGTALRHLRWKANGTIVEDSILKDSGNAVIGHSNDSGTQAIGLGLSTAPFKDLWTNDARIKQTAGTAATLEFLLGNETTAGDSGSLKQVRTFAKQGVKDWLGIVPGDIGAVPITRTLQIIGSAGQVTVAPSTPLALDADLQWTISLPLTTLDTRWVTIETDQAVNGVKTWESTTLTKVMVSFREKTAGKVPGLSFTAGGAILMGDGAVAATGQIDFNSDRIRFSGKSVWFDTTAPVKLTSAIAGSGAPSTLLGLDGSDVVRRVSAADLQTYIGQPTLAAGAVGYGDAGNKLTGDTTRLRFDATNNRLGIALGASSPTEALDVNGAGRFVQTTQTATVGGISATPTDNSTSSAQWTNRNFIAADFQAVKSGSAAFVTSALIYGARCFAKVSDGTVSQAYGVRGGVMIGGTGGKSAAATIAANFFSSNPAADGTAGSVATFAHFYASESLAASAPISACAGLWVQNLVAGVTTTRGIWLQMQKSGSGVRHAIYSENDADSYLAGNLGIGNSAPTARLEFGNNTASQPVVRFATVANALLSTPLANAFEVDANTTTPVNLRGRLYFSDCVPARHILAFLDDCTFTNDGNAQMSGAVSFPATATGSITFAIANLDGQVIGTSDFAVHVRARLPQTVWTVSVGLFSLTSSASGSSGAFDWYMTGTTSGMVLTIRNSGGAASRTWLLPNATLVPFMGKVVDVVVVRSNLVVSIYLNGIPVTPTPTGPAEEVNAVANGAGTFRFHVGGMTFSILPWQDRIYAARIFNRGLSGTEVLDLVRHGTHELDKWGIAKNLALNGDFASVGPWTITNPGGSAIAGGVLTINNNTGSSQLVSQSMTTVFATPEVVAAGGFQGERFRVTETVSGISGSIRMGMAASGLNGPLLVNGLNNFEGVWPNSNTLVYAGVVSPAAAAVIDDFSLVKIGALVDLDFGLVVGNLVWDWSGRFPALLPAIYEVVRPIGGTSSTGGGSGVNGGVEIAFAVRKFTTRFSIGTGGTQVVTHNFGTLNVVVQLWDDSANPPSKVNAAVEATSANAVNIGVANMTATPRNLRCVVMG